MPSVTYREKRSNTWLRIAGPGMVLLAAVILFLRYLADSQLGIMISLGGGMVLTASFGFFLFCREVLLNSNLLVLDAEGLTQVRGGKPRRWLWWDLSSFELREAGVLGPRIEFKVNGRDPGAPQSWLAKLPLAAPPCFVEDLYDTPLEEIATQLNHYRRQALGGATAGQHAYA
jgi:hypothetical protein